MNTQNYVTEKKNTDRSRFSRYCMKAAAGALTLVMIGGCIPAMNPMVSGNGGWTIEASAATADSWRNADKTLKDGKYRLPLSMNNATKPENPSMASSCIVGETQELEVKDGKMVVTVNLQSVTVGPITAWADDWKIYPENNMDGTPVAAEYSTDAEEHVNKIQFTLPDGAYEAGGVFVSMNVPDMGGAVMQAWFAMDFDNVEPEYVNLEDGIYSVNGTMQKPSGEASMSDQAIAHAIKLTVEDGNYFVTMNFKGLNVGSLRGYFSNLKYYNTGYTDTNGKIEGEVTDVAVDSVQKYTNGEILSDSLGTNYPDIVTFPLIQEARFDGKVPLQVFVPIMEAINEGSGTQDVYLVLDWDSVKATTADDPVFAEGDVVDEQPSKTPEEDNQNPGAGQGSGNENKPSGNDQNAQNQNGQNNQNITQTPGTSTQTAALQTGATYTAGGNTYQATSAGTVTLTAVSGKKSVNVPATVTVNGVTAKVTAIGNNAFKKAKKKLKKVTIGANVTTIGKKAFAGCKKLKKITIKSKKLTKVGAKAFKGINKKAVIKVPKKNKKAYTKLLKNKGQAKSVKIR